MELSKSTALTEAEASGTSWRDQFGSVWSVGVSLRSCEKRLSVVSIVRLGRSMRTLSHERALRCSSVPLTHQASE